VVIDRTERPNPEALGAADDHSGMGRIPVPILVTLAVLLAAGPIGLLASARDGHAAAAPPDRLAEIASGPAAR
jgi:hypothetical protein